MIIPPVKLFGKGELHCKRCGNASLHLGKGHSVRGVTEVVMSCNKCSSSHTLVIAKEGTGVLLKWKQ